MTTSAEKRVKKGGKKGSTDGPLGKKSKKTEIKVPGKKKRTAENTISGEQVVQREENVVPGKRSSKKSKLDGVKGKKKEKKSQGEKVPKRTEPEETVNESPAPEKSKRNPYRLYADDLTKAVKDDNNVKRQSEDSGHRGKPPKKKRKKADAEAERAEEEEEGEEDVETAFDLDQVPSDSEDEAESTVKKVKSTKGKQSGEVEEPPAKKLYTDFTVNTVFVGNLPLNYDKNKVVKVFSQFGQVVCARIRCVPIANINMRKKVAAIKKEFNPKRNSLVAYVKFKSEDSVRAAIKANGMVMDGHHIRIDLAEGTQERDVNKAVFVGGLPFGIEDDELWSFFEKCGKINSVRVVRDSHTSMGKGIGYVNFDSTTSVELALQMDGQELNKRTINVKRCFKTDPKKKMKTFGKAKTKEMIGELLSKRNQTKMKAEKKKKQQQKTKGKGSGAGSVAATAEFVGNKATMKKKKKKKPSHELLRKKKIVKILKGPSK